jgi:hypothetical protein
MATRSTIAIEFADGTVQQVYCHWDGYLDHNGKLLQEYYSNPFILRDLVDQGAISSLGPIVGTKHDFSRLDSKLSAEEYEDRYGTMTTFYARDRGEELVVSKFKDFQEYTREAQREEYDYILRNVNGQATWFVSFYGTDGEYLTMAEAFEFQKARQGEEA